MGSLDENDRKTAEMNPSDHSIKFTPALRAANAEPWTAKTKGRVASFALGMIVAWLGLPAMLHVGYWVAIVAAFFLGRHW